MILGLGVQVGVASASSAAHAAKSHRGKTKITSGPKKLPLKSNIIRYLKSGLPKS